MTKMKWIRILKSGSLWGVITSLSGAMMGPPVLNYLPTKYAGIMIIAGTLLTALSQSIPQLILDIMDEPNANMGQGG